MGFTLKVGGSVGAEIGIENILAVEFKTDTPDDSNARSTDLGTTVEIRGKILTALDGTFDQTVKLAAWSIIPAESFDAYADVQLDVISASKVVRKYTLPNAYVVNYEEVYGDTAGVGEFTLLVKQKKDKTKDVKFEGGFDL